MSDRPWARNKVNPALAVTSFVGKNSGSGPAQSRAAKLPLPCIAPGAMNTRAATGGGKGWIVEESRPAGMLN